jgi:type I restriction enzyme S subunit
MKQGWEIKRLSEIGKVYNGNSINEKVKRDNYSDLDNGFPFIATKDISYENLIDYDNGIKIPFAEKSSFKTAPKNTVLICAEGGSAGRKIGFTNQEVCFGNKLFALATNKNIESRYVYYYYFSETFQKHFAVELAGIIGGVSMNKFKDLEIPLPPLPEQQSIVTILDEAFAAINKAKVNAEQNLKNAKELFESYLQGVFENKGDNWEEKTLGEIADVEYGYTDKSTEEGDYRYIRITDIDKNGELILDDKKYIKHSKEAEGFIIQDNDLLMARTGATFAKVLLYNGDEPSVFASYLIRIKFKEKIENALYWHFTKTKYYWEQANSLQSGAAQPHFNGAAVKQVIFSYPKSTKEQKVLIEKFETLSVETKKLEAIYQTKINDLEELKKSVLQKAFSGELKTAKALV